MHSACARSEITDNGIESIPFLITVLTSMGKESPSISKSFVANCLVDELTRAFYDAWKSLPFHAYAQDHLPRNLINKYLIFAYAI